MLSNINVCLTFKTLSTLFQITKIIVLILFNMTFIVLFDINISVEYDDLVLINEKFKSDGEDVVPSIEFLSCSNKIYILYVNLYIIWIIYFILYLILDLVTNFFFSTLVSNLIKKCTKLNLDKKSKFEIFLYNLYIGNIILLTLFNIVLIFFLILFLYYVLILYRKMLSYHNYNKIKQNTPFEEKTCYIKRLNNSNKNTITSIDEIFDYFKLNFKYQEIRLFFKIDGKQLIMKFIGRLRNKCKLYDSTIMQIKFEQFKHDFVFKYFNIKSIISKANNLKNAINYSCIDNSIFIFSFENCLSFCIFFYNFIFLFLLVNTIIYIICLYLIEVFYLLQKLNIRSFFKNIKIYRFTLFILSVIFILIYVYLLQLNFVWTILNTILIWMVTFIYVQLNLLLDYILIIFDKISNNNVFNVLFFIFTIWLIIMYTNNFLFIFMYFYLFLFILIIIIIYE